MWKEEHRKSRMKFRYLCSYIVYAENMLIYSFCSVGYNVRYSHIVGKGKESCMDKLKLFESILKAAAALVAAVISVAKVIGSMIPAKA